MNDDPRKRELIDHCQRQFIELIQTGVHEGGAAMEKLVADLPESEVRLLLLVALGQQIHNHRRRGAAPQN